MRYSQHHDHYGGTDFDQETNLHYNYVRDYDPAIGRYIQSDPVGLLGGLNTYSYVDNSPINFSDFLGLAPVGDIPADPNKPAIFFNVPPMNPALFKITKEAFDQMTAAPNISGKDNFFHCMAACRAVKTGHRPNDVVRYMQTKEYVDYGRNILGRYGNRGRLPHEDMLRDMRHDRAMNIFGAQCPPSITCEDRCLQTMGPGSQQMMREHLGIR